MIPLLYITALLGAGIAGFGLGSFLAYQNARKRLRKMAGIAAAILREYGVAPEEVAELEKLAASKPTVFGAPTHAK